jgi:hypothetical protein
MIKKFGSDVTVNVIASVFASLIFLVAGFFWGRYQERQHYGKNLDEYALSASSGSRFQTQKSKSYYITSRTHRIR